MHKANLISQNDAPNSDLNLRIIGSHYPEFKISSYTSVDGSVEFYSRINSLLKDSMIVLDFGAGRGAWNEDSTCLYRKSLRNLQGKVKKIIGCDIDEAIYDNSTVDETIMVKVGETLPFENNSLDLIISDFTFEHIENDREVAEEFTRILKVGGWVCARTPNKFYYISILTQFIKNNWHRKLLKFIQPLRKDIDVFPTKFKMNSIKKINQLFPANQYENYTYFFEPEPAYFFGNKFIFSVMKILNSFLPSYLKANIFIFMRKK